MFNNILIILIDIIFNFLQVFLLRLNQGNNFLIALRRLLPHFTDFILHSLFHGFQQLGHLIECLIDFPQFLVVELTDHSLVIAEEKLDLLGVSIDLL